MSSRRHGERLSEGRDKDSLPFFLSGSNPGSLVISLILFSISIGYRLPSLSFLGGTLVLAYSLLIILYIIAYGLNLKKQQKALSSLATASYALSLLLFLASTYLWAISIPLLQSILSIFTSIESITAYLIMLILLFFTVQLYFYTENRKAKMAVIAAVIIIAAVYFTSSIIRYTADDETVIAYYGIRNLASGVDPYSQSISSIIYGSRHLLGEAPTITANNTIAATLDYPALYLLVQVPFYFASSQNVADITGGFMHLEGFIFFLIFMFAYFLMTSSRKIKPGPEFLAYLALGIMLSVLSSLVVLLMLAVIMLMYSDLGKKYSWLLIGIAISLQEQLWIMALLYLAYSFSSYGIRKGARDLIGALAVFLIINSYFILAGPVNYANSFITVTSNLLPESLSPIGYLVASSYPIPLQYFTYIFISSIAFTLLLSIYLNQKKLIPLLSIIPFLFLGHALLIYYLFPITVFAFASGAESSENQSRIPAPSKSRAARQVLFAAMLVSVISMPAIIYAGHSVYAGKVNLTAHNQSASISEGNITYSSELSYVPQNNTAVYLLFEVNGGDTYYGFYNTSLVKGSLNCSFPCSINVNRIILTGSGQYNLTAEIPANVTGQGSVYAVIYNKNYYYQSTPVHYN